MNKMLNAVAGAAIVSIIAVSATPILADASLAHASTAGVEASDKGSENGLGKAGDTRGSVSASPRGFEMGIGIRGEAVPGGGNDDPWNDNGE
jgi:hypothetical protein